MNVSTPTYPPEVAQARAAAYTLIARTFQYPDRSLIETLADPERWSNWTRVVEMGDAEIGRLLESVQGVLRTEAKALADCPDAQPTELQERYDRLFGHAVRGKCPTYELEYGRSEIIQQSSELADLAGFYRAFGMEIVDASNGRPDHITAECEFMGSLCGKEAFAIAEQSTENLEVCTDAQRAFLKDHLAGWLPAFALRVDRADAAGLYGAMARFVSAFIAAECSRFDVHAGPQTLKLRPTDPVLDRTIDCGPTDCQSSGAGEQLIQLGVDFDRNEEQ